MAMGVRCDDDDGAAQPLALSREELRLKAILLPNEGI